MDQDYGTPFPPLENQTSKKSNTIWIILIVVLVVICCCCAVLGALAAGFYQYGDQIFGITWLQALPQYL